MSKNVTPTIREGSPTARDVYLSVGMALSWWEASEDMLEMLFVHLCKMKEPIAIETFRVAPRPARTAMIKSALKHHASRVTAQEATAVIDAMKNLEKLSSTRNEIAHGYVWEINSTVDGSVTMRGSFLASTLGPMGIQASRKDNIKYAHTAEEIDEWRDKVRQERGRIVDVWEAILIRDQEGQQQVGG